MEISNGQKLEGLSDYEWKPNEYWRDVTRNLTAFHVAAIQGIKESERNLIEN